MSEREQDETPHESVTAWEAVAGRATPPPTVLLDGGRTEVGPAPETGDAPIFGVAGRYTILGEIARGGMGAVMKGRDSGLNRDLAVKVLLEKYRGNVEVTRRFFEEAQICGQLQHPGIVPVHDLGVLPDGRPFFAMKLVKGRTLAEMLAGRPARVEHKPEAQAKDHSKEPSLALQACEIRATDLPRFLAVFEAVAQAVAYAHSRDVIHRDLKPANVMVGAFGEVQVMDWGLAKVLTPGATAGPAPEAQPEPAYYSVIDSGRDGSDSGATSAGSRLGTPAYMPPEQARGEVERMGKPSDVFSLGAILCEVLTGFPAYRGSSSAETLRRAEFADLGDCLSRLDSCGADPALISLARACVAREPGDRPADASSVASSVAAHLAAVQERLRAAEIARVEADARAEVERARAESGRARLRMAMAAALSTLLAVVVGGGWFLTSRLAAQARRAESDGIVGAAVAKAEALAGEAGRAGPDAIEAWRSALSAAESAKAALAGRPASPALAGRVEASHAAASLAMSRARERAERLVADRRLVRGLDEARLAGAAVKDGHFDTAARTAAYASTFREAGIAFGRQPTAEIAARLSGAEGRERIAAALDDWSSYAPAALKPDLAAVAGAIDPARNPLRRAIRSGDRAALLAVAREGPAGLTAPAAVLLAGALIKRDARDEAIAVLRAALARSPGDIWLNHDLGVTLDAAKPPRPEEAVRYLTAALALRPDSAGVHSNLGNALGMQGKPAEAESAHRAAIALDPRYAMAHVNLGTALRDQGKPAEAESAYRAAIALDPKFAPAHNNLGRALRDQGKVPEAESAYRAAIALDPKLAPAHVNLGNALRDQGKPAEAESAHRAAIALDPKYALAHNNLGAALGMQGKPAEAESAYRAAIALDPKFAPAHNNLGSALRDQGKVPEAESAYRAAIALDPKFAMAHSNLGSALRARDKLPEAESAYRAAIALDPEYADAHCNLGHLLRVLGRFDEALEEYRLGHELGSGMPGWNSPSAEWVRQAEGMVALAKRLPAVVKGEDRPRDAAEGLALAKMGYDKGLHAAASRLWAAALESDPKLAEDRRAPHRYDAACAAALAGCGRGKDDPAPDEAARAKLRAQALGWLRAELSAWKRVAMTVAPDNKESVAGALAHWKRDGDLAGVRDEAGLAKLPEAERADWKALWADVDDLLKTARR